MFFSELHLSHIATTHFLLQSMPKWNTVSSFKYIISTHITPLILLNNRCKLYLHKEIYYSITFSTFANSNIPHTREKHDNNQHEQTSYEKYCNQNSRGPRKHIYCWRDKSSYPYNCNRTSWDFTNSILSRRRDNARHRTNTAAHKCH